jgi:uncharacterized repeat protein (TIGR03803 family)
LYTFAGRPDASEPYAGLILDTAGNLYGTTVWGGHWCVHDYGCGAVFKLDTTGKETLLHSFSRQGDGTSPVGGLLADGEGDMYGTASGGGAHGKGVVFEVTP